METTKNVYIIIAVLFIIPLIGFNIFKIFSKDSKKKLVFKPVRAVVVTVISILIGLFLFASYQATLERRYEIFIEKLATAHSEYLVGKTSGEKFENFLNENKSSKADLEVNIDSELKGKDEVSFRFADYLVPQIWTKFTAFEKVEVIDDIIPAYALYYIESGDVKEYYLIRLTNENDEWKIDYFGTATEEQKGQFRKIEDVGRKTYEIKK